RFVVIISRAVRDLHSFPTRRSSDLFVILFRDGLEVEQEMLQREWRPPFRKLVLAMPITAVLVAVAAHVLTDLSWTECFLVGALLDRKSTRLNSSHVAISYAVFGVKK